MAIECAQQRVLVVDDEERIRKLLRLYLERENYQIDEVENGEKALEMAMEQDYHLILLDRMLPGIDGVEVCQRLREKKATPVIMITAKGEEADRIEGFEVGTDDYLCKPFSPREVVLRVKAMLQRTSSTAFLKTERSSSNVLIFPFLTIDNDAHKVTMDGEEVNLTPKEYDLLLYLAKNQGKVFSREALLKDVWHYEYFGDLRTVDTHVKRLREKLSQVNPAVAEMISTVWGIGYKLEMPQ